MITILDLMKLCCYFKEDSCTFGRECDSIMNHYKQINIAPKYVHERTEFTIQQYLKIVPYSCLIEDMEYALVGQVKAKLNEKVDEHYDEEKPKTDVEAISFPLDKEWRMRSIFHQDEMPEDYKANLGRREGRTAEKDLDKYQKTDKPF